MTVTIEGIETPQQAALTSALKCQYGQGYLWSEPVPAGAVTIGAAAPLAVPSIGSRPGVGPSVPWQQHHPDPCRGDALVAGPNAVAAAGQPALGPTLAAAVLEATPDATAVVDEAGTIVAVNRAWRMFALDNGGSEGSTGVGVNYRKVCERAAHSGNAEARQVYADLSAVVAGRYREAELEYPCSSPAIGRWFLLRISRLSGSGSGAVISHVNITRRKMAENELAHGASHDPLTGLANRTLLHARLRKALARPNRWEGVGTGVLLVDLDGFKVINDTFGHASGDEVVIPELANRA